MHKIIILMMFPILLSACNQGKLEQLEKENASLRSKIAELSETEQNRFNKAVDVLNTANDLQSYRKAEKTFGDFIEKFPTSTYIAEARKNEQSARKKADVIEKISTVKAEVASLIEQRKWNMATKKVNSIKLLIEKNEYNSLLKQIREERYKPRKTTIDQLRLEISEMFIAYEVGEEPGYRRFRKLYLDGERVELIGYAPSYGFINTTYKTITLWSRPGCMKGENMDIHYEKTNKASYFFNVDPDTIPCGTAYKVVGNISALSNGNPWFEAETIERI